MSPILLFHANVFTTSACLIHSNFFKVKVPSTVPHIEVQIQFSEKMPRPIQMLTRKGGPTVLGRSPTTSVLNATPLIYAIGAGITAAAGTRFAFQLILVKRFKFYSFQLQDMDVLYCYFLSRPPCVRIGKFARLLSSLEVVAVCQAPSPESNPNSLLPVTAMVGQYPTIEC